MSGYVDTVSKLLRVGRRRTPRLAQQRGRRATFQPLRDESLRVARWVPLG